MQGILCTSLLLILAATIVSAAPITIGPDGLASISPIDKILEESGYQLIPPASGKAGKLLDQLISTPSSPQVKVEEDGLGDDLPGGVAGGFTREKWTELN